MISNSLSINFRPQDAADAKFLADLFVADRAEEFRWSGLDESQLALLLDQQQRAQDAHYRAQFPKADFSIVESGGECIGRLIVDKGTQAHHLVDIVLVPRFRGRGLGGKAVAGLLSQASQQNLPVRLHVKKGNPAQRLYERLGFVALEERGIHIYMECPPPSADLP
jgi:ribosomal protein S18 acetylase RimI-like enzyme